MAGALVATEGRALAAEASTAAVNVERYQPTPFANRFFQLEQGATLPRGVFRVGLDVDYGARSLVVQDLSPRIDLAGTGRGRYDVLKGVVGTNLLASVGLGHHLELGLAVPVIAYQYGDDTPDVPAPARAGVGQPRLGLKAGLLHAHGFEMAAAGLLGLPSLARDFVGSGDVSGELGVSGGYQRGAWTLGLNLAAHLAKEREVFDRHVGSEWLAGAGLAWSSSVRTSVLAEVMAATPLAAIGRAHESPVESLFGVRHRKGRLIATVGAGPGLVAGIGAPTFRALAGLAFASEIPDSDEDGVDDDRDRCLEEPEDRDGFEDDDGCPDPDNDKDGILDVADRCPLDAEDKDGFEDEDGCPDLDNDKDGILDAADKCPDKPETKNGFEDEDGCPDELPPPSDKDKDGILDDDDECPDEAEDKDGFEDEDGCPDPDNDKDGIPDAQDKCPLEPETINGVTDDDGCPDKGQAAVRLKPDEIETLRPIYFDTDHSRVRHVFHPILSQIALLLKAHPEIGRCAVEGHTDDTGPPDWNQRLSALRASAVVEFLVSKGVDRQRLSAMGRGEQLPWASNDTPWGRARNRRVIFHVEGVDAEGKRKESTREERRETIKKRRAAKAHEAEGAEGENDAEKEPTPAELARDDRRRASGGEAAGAAEERMPPVDVLPSREEAALRRARREEERRARKEAAAQEKAEARAKSAKAARAAEGEPASDSEEDKIRGERPGTSTTSSRGRGSRPTDEVEERTPPVDEPPSRTERRQRRAKSQSASNAGEPGSATSTGAEETPPKRKKGANGKPSETEQGAPNAESRGTRRSSAKGDAATSKKPSAADEGEATKGAGAEDTKPGAERGSKPGSKRRRSGEADASPEKSEKAGAKGKKPSGTSFEVPAPRSAAEESTEAGEGKAGAGGKQGPSRTSRETTRTRTGVRGAAIEENADAQDPLEAPKKPKKPKVTPLAPPPSSTAEPDAAEKRRRRRRAEAPKAEEPSLQDLLRLPVR